jgi:hypothetical protein
VVTTGIERPEPTVTAEPKPIEFTALTICCFVFRYCDTVFFGEAATSEAACDYAETIAPGHCELTHASDEAYWETIWYWATPREDCDDADSATTCKTQDDWVEAWTTLRGN